MNAKTERLVMGLAAIVAGVIAMANIWAGHAVASLCWAALSTRLGRDSMG
jgi:hypothetical protein